MEEGTRTQIGAARAPTEVAKCPPPGLPISLSHSFGLALALTVTSESQVSSEFFLTHTGDSVNVLVLLRASLA